MDEDVPQMNPVRKPAAGTILAFFGSLFLAAFLSLLFNPRSLCGGLSLEKAKIVCPFLF
jgi:hypothetical protein